MPPLTERKQICRQYYLHSPLLEIRTTLNKNYYARTDIISLMTKLFLSISISGFMDSKIGKIDSAYMAFVKDVISSLREQGFSVFCGLNTDSSTYPNTSTKIIVEADMEQIKNANILLALITSAEISAGQQFELGYASGLGKKIIIATPDKTELLFMNQGMVDLGRIKHLQYTDIKNLTHMILKIA